MVDNKYFDKDKYPVVKYHTFPNTKGKVIAGLLPGACVRNGIMDDGLGRGPHGCPIDSQLTDNGWVYDEGVFYDPSVWTREEIDNLLQEGAKYQEMEREVALLQKKIDEVKGRMKKVKGPVVRRVRKKRSPSGNL